MKSSIKILIPALAVFLAVWTGTSADRTSDTIPKERVEEIWRGECASCHGPDGKGQTRAGRRAGVEDFTDVSYQQSWTDAEAVQVIKTATKDGKELRNKNPYVDELSDAEIKALVAYVRGFAGN